MSKKETSKGKADTKVEQIKVSKTAKGALQVELTAALKTEAVNTINAFSKAWDASKGQATNLSNILLDMGKHAMDRTDGNNDLALAIFLEQCKHAEKVYREAHKVDGEAPPITELLPAWAPTKSEIKRAMSIKNEEGERVDIRECNTIYEMIKDRKEHTPPRGRNQSGGKDDGNTIEVTQPIADAMILLNKTIAAVPADKEDAVLAALAKVTAELRELVPERKDQGPHRAAVEGASRAAA